jgi:aspartate aminotransferase/aminotransferase
MVGDIAKSKGLIVISDEIYEHFLYDGRRHYSIGSIYPGTLTLKGFAKSYGMTGWRLGYVCGPGEIIRNMTVLQQYSFTCAPSVAQYAALTALESDVSPQIRDYQEKRDLIHNGLKDKYKVNKPEGAFYIFPEAPGKSAVEFINLCLEKELYVIPGDAFSGRDTHFRLSFAASREKLIRGIEVLNKLI